MKISECMTQDVCFVKPDCNTYDAARIMCENHIGCIPVCNDEKNVVGIITDRDILLRAVACNKETKTTPVSEIMTTNVYTCNSEKEVTEAQNLMAQNAIKFVMRNAGNVTEKVNVLYAMIIIIGISNVVVFVKSVLMQSVILMEFVWIKHQIANQKSFMEKNAMNYV